jgi:hypothetical protein
MMVSFEIVLSQDFIVRNTRYLSPVCCVMNYACVLLLHSFKVEDASKAGHACAMYAFSDLAELYLWFNPTTDCNSAAPTITAKQPLRIGSPKTYFTTVLELSKVIFIQSPRSILYRDT